MEATLETVSAYELERGKPIPDPIHAIVQGNLLFELRSRYGTAYRVLPELALATVPDGTTPDLALYPAFVPDYVHRQAQRTDPPALCIEIQSPSQSIEEMLGKVGLLCGLRWLRPLASLSPLSKSFTGAASGTCCCLFCWAASD